jgi:hypothetical protein
MKAKDILVELDYYSITLLIENYQWMVQCNPKMVNSLKSDEDFKDSFDNKYNDIWSKTQAFRNTFNGEVIRRGNRMTRPCVFSVDEILEMAKYMIFWFDYRIDWGKRDIERLENLKLSQPEQVVIDIVKESKRHFEKVKEEMVEFCEVLEWKFKGGKKPKIHHIFWFGSNFDIHNIEYSMNPQKKDEHNLTNVLNKIEK